MTRAIRFLRFNRWAIPVGGVVRWDYGQSELLVHSGVAEWAEPAEQPAQESAPATEPEPTVEPEPEPETPKRRKRSETTEE